MVEILLKGIQKSFNGHQVIRNVDLEVARGEFLVLVGPSGCGKTTLLRLVAGLEEIDAGEIRIGDRRANEMSPRDRDVAMVFQSYALYPHMTVRENMAFGLTLRGLPKAQTEERVLEVAGWLELTGLLDRKPGALSGGQRQRVAMGRAIARQPRIFLFDEPLSNLDAALRIHVRGDLVRLHRRLEATMVYVTHDQVEAMTLASRLAVLHHGTLQQVGPPLELYHRPANRFVASFLGAPPMNFLEARRESNRFVGKEFSLPVPEGLDSRVGGKVLGDVLLGLRPQALRVCETGPFRGQVEAIERLGFDGYVFLEMPGGALAARFDPGIPVRVGDSVHLELVGNALHVFSPSGDRAWWHPEEVVPPHIRA